MVSDALALALAAFAARLARRPPSVRHTYGLVRAEVIAASANGILMLILIGAILVEAIIRLADPRPVAGDSVALVGAVGLVVNLIVAWLLHRGGGEDLNTRGAMLHVMGDVLGSIAALAAGLVIHFTGWMPIDPLLSILVAALILVSTLALLRDALNVLMEAVPRGVQIDRVGAALTRLQGVRSVHDLHVWTLASGRRALSAHLELDDLGAWPAVLAAARTTLRRQFDIDHVTLQPECAHRPPTTGRGRIPIKVGHREVGP